MGLIKHRSCITCKKEYATDRKKYQKQRSLIKKLLGFCPCCERYFRYSITTQRRNTAYVEEADNWLTSCKECHNEDDAYFADLWDQYYESIQEDL